MATVWSLDTLYIEDSCSLLRVDEKATWLMRDEVLVLMKLSPQETEQFELDSKRRLNNFRGGIATMYLHAKSE